LPGIFVLALLTGNTLISAILILFSVIGVITGYIAHDSEEEVGKFGSFIMIVSIITLAVALVLAILI
jgi:phage-related holin